MAPNIRLGNVLWASICDWQYLSTCMHVPFSTCSWAEQHTRHRRLSPVGVPATEAVVADAAHTRAQVRNHCWPLLAGAARRGGFAQQRRKLLAVAHTPCTSPQSGCSSGLQLPEMQGRHAKGTCLGHQDGPKCVDLKVLQKAAGINPGQGGFCAMRDT